MRGLASAAIDAFRNVPLLLQLLAWYFIHQHRLHAHGVQVRSGKDETLGEFDFLLRSEEGLLHWEFATKFYLLYSDNPALAGVQQADYFVGPNLWSVRLEKRDGSMLSMDIGWLLPAKMAMRVVLMKPS